MASAILLRSALVAVLFAAPVHAIPPPVVEQAAHEGPGSGSLTRLLSLPVNAPAAHFGLAPTETSRRAVAFLQQHAALSTPDDSDVGRTLRSLDTNGDGKIDRTEIAIFAQAQGLDAASSAKELSLSDIDGDGALNVRELSFMLAGQTSVAESPPVARQVPVAPVGQPGMATPAASPSLAAGVAPQQPPSPLRVRPQPQASTQPQLVAVSDAAVGTLGGIEAQASGISAHAMASTAEMTSSIDTFKSAQSATNAFVEQLAVEEKEEQAAQELEQRAAELRANSTALSQRMIQRALAAGSKAATAKAQEVLGSILSLEAEEARKEVAAAALRAKAKDELRQANELMSVADTVLKPVMPAGA